MSEHDRDCRRYGERTHDLVHLDVHHCDECAALAIRLSMTEWVAIEERP